MRGGTDISKEQIFPCDRCGLCCQHLTGVESYEDLDDGTGVCRYFDHNSKLCTIYDQRPQKCRVKESYIYYQALMSYDEYIQMNIEGCKRLKEEYLCHCHS